MRAADIRAFVGEARGPRLGTSRGDRSEARGADCGQRRPRRAAREGARSRRVAWGRHAPRGRCARERGGARSRHRRRSERGRRGARATSRRKQCRGRHRRALAAGRLDPPLRPLAVRRRMPDGRGLSDPQDRRTYRRGDRARRCARRSGSDDCGSDAREPREASGDPVRSDRARRIAPRHVPSAARSRTGSHGLEAARTCRQVRPSPTSCPCSREGR